MRNQIVFIFPDYNKDGSKTPSFSYNLKKRTKISSGYFWTLQVDISSFFPSFYTHSIPWALEGKEVSKKNTYNNNNSKSLSDEIDDFLRDMNNGETQGIPTGPKVSYIISEIVMSQIDKELQDKNFVFSRFVDDFHFYFSAEHEAKQKLREIYNVLNKWRLRINDKKTKISRFPNNIDGNFFFDTEVYSKNLKNIRNWEILTRLFLKKMQVNEKGVGKYYLKIINDNSSYISKKVAEDLWPVLLNLLVSNSNLGKWIYQILKDKKNEFTKIKSFKTRLNRLFKECVDGSREEELISWIFKIWCIFNDGKIEDEENIIMKCFKLDSDFLKILVYSKFQNKYPNLKDEMMKYLKDRTSNSEQEKELRGKRWLILYTCIEKGWLKYNEIGVEKKHYLKPLEDKKISFFNPNY